MCIVEVFSFLAIDTIIILNFFLRTYEIFNFLAYRVTPSRVHIMIYSRRRYNEAVKSIFSLVKVRIIEGSNKRIDASFDLSPASPHPPLLKNRRQTRCRCDQSVIPTICFNFHLRIAIMYERSIEIFHR